MANLPIELWHLIFDRLQLAELFSCALASKMLYFSVKEYRIREIAFTGRVHRWFHPTPTNHKYRIDFRYASILKVSSLDFEYLRRLKIGRSSAIDLNVINKFTQLEELDIDLKNYVNEKSKTLSLANLKVLYVLMSIYRCHGENGYIRTVPYVELDTPRLAELYTFSLKRLEFVYPESVRCIHTFFHDRKLSTFRNLECLIFTDCYNLLDYPNSCISYSKRFKEFSLAALKKLKEIHFYYAHLTSYNPTWSPKSRYIQENISVFRKVTENLLALRRPGLKLFWQNVPIVDTDLLTEQERMIKNGSVWIAFQLQHYEKLTDKVNFLWGFEFNSTISELPKAGFDPNSEEFLSKFFAKFLLRRILILYGLEEEELLLEFIARSPNLLSLNFVESDVGQEFFDQMAETIQLNAIPLQQFSLEGSSSGVLNFEFVSRLQDLEQFVTDQQLPAELIAKLLRLSKVSDIKFGTSRGKNGLSSRGFRIERMSVSRYRLNEKPLSLQELLEQFGLVETTIASCDSRPSRPF